MDAILRESLRMASRATTTVSIAMNATISGNEIGKSPIEELSRQHNWVFAGYMVLLALGALFTFWVWHSGNRLQAAIQADADVRIQEARQGITKLENENLKLRNDLETEIGKVASLQKDAADAKAAQQKVEVELAKQRERTAVAEQELLRLKESLKDRTISPGQRYNLIELLKTPVKGPVEIWWVTGAPDSYALALQIQEAFRLSGWPNPTEHMAVGAANAAGFFIAVQNFSTPPQHAVTIERAFASAGLPLKHFPDRDTPVGTVRIYIGPKVELP